MPFDPHEQIKALATHIVRTYEGGSYVTGHAAVEDARSIMATINDITYIEIYQCDGCGIYYEPGDLAEDGSTRCCGGSTTVVRALSRRRKR